MKYFVEVIVLIGWLVGGKSIYGEKREMGTPFFSYYSAEVYGAHDRNNDVVCDGKGNCYFANLEGILKYDGQRWELYTTPGISRITALAVGEDDKVYVGGYQFAGVLEGLDNGEMNLRTFLSDTISGEQQIGEVEKIQIEANKVVFVTRHVLLTVEKDSVCIVKRIEEEKLEEYCTAVCDLPDGRKLIGRGTGLWVCQGKKETRLVLTGIPEAIYINDILITQKGEIVVATATHGVFFLTLSLRLVGVVNEARGLCSNVVNALADDGEGSLWMATGQGIARLLYASMYSGFTEREGLPGEVLSVIRYRGILYAGTYRGLFYLDQARGEFRQVPGLVQACWQLSEDKNGILWAATAGGVFQVQERRAQAVSSYFTMAVLVKDGIYTGEQDALYRNEWENGELVRKESFPWEQINQIVTSQDGDVWVATISGKVGRLECANSTSYIQELKGLKRGGGNRISVCQGRLVVVSRNGFYEEVGRDSLGLYEFLKDSLGNGWWPGICVEGKDSISWLTRGDEKGITTVQRGYLLSGYAQRLKAIEGYAIRVIYPESGGITWLGGNFGLIRVDLHKNDPAFESLPVVYIRRIIRSAGNPRNIRFTFATKGGGVISPLKFSCRLKGFDKDWGEWQEKNMEEYVRLPYGKYIFQARVCDVFGRMGYSPEISFEIAAPFHLRWYACVIYVVLFCLGVVGVIRWRTWRLLQEKEQLERVIEIRTREVRQQRDEIKEKSESLEQTLGQLKQTQHELIRQEKMATVGKLTQGLVDRILNPLNYIGNFALMSKNLSEDAVRIIEEEKENVPIEVKEELTEIMEILATNLDKIAGHGESTARILKAMEEIMRERKCVLAPVKIGVLCDENLETFRKYWQSELDEKGVHLVYDTLIGEKVVQIDKEQLGKVLLSILNNGMLALLKKIEKENFVPELVVSLEDIVEGVRIVIKDNGIGIEQQIIDKVFDPFFTTRTTAEAAGVGLYLSREVVLNHRGSIGIHSEKGMGTEVWIEIYEGK